MGGLAAAIPGDSGGGERPGDRSGERFAKGMEALLERGRGPDSSWSRGEPQEGDSPTSGDDGDLGWRCFAGRMGREEAEALLRCVVLGRTGFCSPVE